ncbi:sugar phosphate isomerase/epimerase family protein [Microbacterium sp. 2MCAF23]|uniref:sugar phosphate isomerase/epimerase family protein n=1 Tax=Microbacterium sp. 2MCAF23 TaxID=3232985 RepID=UPI003F9436F3
MRIGIDARHAPWTRPLTALEQVADAADRGMEGIFFRTMLDMSSALDPGELRDIRALADERGIYLESGLGKVNTYALAETPEVREIGDGDTVLGFRRMIEAAGGIGLHELWVSTGGYKQFGGRFTYDRYRTDVSWGDQLAAIDKFVHVLAPIARDHGTHLNAETHEEITSFELVRLIESVGDDVMGIVYDTGNPLQRAESPAETARRVAPYVRQTHLKDVALFFDPLGIRHQPRPIGEGVIDMRAVLGPLVEANPGLNLSIESGGPWARPEGVPEPAPGIALYDPVWIEGHPDLLVGEFAAYLSLAQQYADRVSAGERASFEAMAGHPVTVEEAWDWIRRSATTIRTVLAQLGADDAVPV